jgi:hypothetical protein
VSAAAETVEDEEEPVEELEPQAVSMNIPTKRKSKLFGMEPHICHLPINIYFLSRGCLTNTKRVHNEEVYHLFYFSLAKWV